MADDEGPLHFVLKVVSRCNLNCSYCYVYNKGDETWRDRPAIMPTEVFKVAVERIFQHCLRSRQPTLSVVFHGGEPCLAGSTRFSEWCSYIEQRLGGLTRLRFSLQTNGTLLDKGWIDVLCRHQVSVGLSSDGPKELHDVFRVDHKGHGSYDLVKRGIDLLKGTPIPLEILSVIQLGADGLRIHHHFLDLGVRRINYLFPDFSHDTIAPVLQTFGPTPCSDFLIPIFEDWWRNDTLDTKIGIFWNIARLILGGPSHTDVLGNQPFRFIFIEADGAIEGLDVLRVCSNGMAKMGLNVLSNDFSDLRNISDLHQASIFEGMDMPSACHQCPEATTCSGGYLPHRYSSVHGFDMPSVWCADILRLFTHIRERLGVSCSDTQRRRQVLADFASN